MRKTIRITDGTHKLIKKIAKKEMRTLTQILTLAVATYALQIPGGINVQPIKTK